MSKNANEIVFYHDFLIPNKQLAGSYTHSYKMLCLINVFRTVHRWFTFTANKAVPLQGWSDPDVSRKLKFPDFMTMAQDGGKVVSLTHRPPLPQDMLLVIISVRG